ncbi:putative cytochrome P450 [Polyplosphaeria fusca]|uniref:Cytochrome P450 n=1 Tax=Polyplosphaeria fusca TaxID=682080 RepID=A0A9P4V4C4_9PLEO|nr:putative cytochrome P450 [Polyplosphaeria fusca]
MAAFDLVSALISPAVLCAALVVFGAYVVVLYVFRIYFSPISHIPGPKWAAATRWYEFYFDAIKNGKYYLEVEKMHETYGPIVRITPYEVHINDPSFFNELYTVSKRLDKDPWYYSWLNRTGSIFGTAQTDLHKLRSPIIKKAFSTASLSRVEHVLKGHIATLCRRIQESKEERKALNMSDIFRSLAVDVVTDLSLPESLSLLETPDYGREHADFVRTVTELSLFSRHLPWFIPLLEATPRWIVGLQGETALHVADGVKGQKNQAQRVIENNGRPIGSKNFPVVMNEVYKSPDLPPSEKTPKRLFDEISILIGAGSETTGHTMATITYHVLANPDVQEKVRKELQEAFTENERKEILSYKQLETLPYLNACISEGLRLATSVSGRLPRINHTAPTTYTSTSRSYTVPPGTPMSMSIRDMHYNEELFPDPWDFKPERWLGPAAKENEKWFAPFNRGARSCVGRLLAMAELQMAMGNIFSKWDVRMSEGVRRRDVEMEHDCFAPFPARDAPGVLIEVF